MSVYNQKPKGQLGNFLRFEFLFSTPQPSMNVIHSLAIDNRSKIFQVKFIHGISMQIRKKNPLYLPIINGRSGKVQAKAFH